MCFTPDYNLLLDLFVEHGYYPNPFVFPPARIQSAYRSLSKLNTTRWQQMLAFDLGVSSGYVTHFFRHNLRADPLPTELRLFFEFGTYIADKIALFSNETKMQSDDRYVTLLFISFYLLLATQNEQS